MPQLVNDNIQPAAANELHHVVMYSLLLADSEHGHDVCVMQTRRGTGFAKEALRVVLQQRGGKRQHFQGDTPPERLLLGLVHDAHSATTNFSEDAEVSERP